MRSDIPPPPFEFQTLVCGPGYESDYENVGRWLVQQLQEQGMLSAGIDFLDVGCGCGRAARFLMSEPIGTYEGFDRHPGMIAWCKEVITPVDRRFRFSHVDVKSAYDEWDAHAGTIDADHFVFPYPSGAFDSILLASIFTHMPFHEVSRYLHELNRVLRAGGRILLSTFLAEGPAFRKDGVNFFHEPNRFLAAVSAAGMEASPTAPEPLYGYQHNWYVLTDAES